MYVEDHASYRTVAKRLTEKTKIDIARMSVFRWVNATGEVCKDPVTMAKELSPSWGGILGIDGKSVFIKGIENILLTAVDIPTQDIVSFMLADGETYNEISLFLNEINKEIKYPISGIVSDLNKQLLLAIGDIFPKVPHQACVNHLDRHFYQIIPHSKSHPHYLLNEELRVLTKRILFAPDINLCYQAYTEMERNRAKFNTIYLQQVIRTIRKHFSKIITHFYYPDIPRDNNITENVIKQLNKKIKKMEGFQSKETAYNTIKLIVTCYRFKKFTDSRNKDNNNKSPLMLAGIDTTNMDWLDYAKGKN